ncbi:MAG TPA: lysophospholipid acyltransferase family protein [Gemmatimonadaceae bacterium]
MTRVPSLPPAIPRRHRPLLQRIGRLGMKVLGWQIEGELPDLPKFVIIVVPHTSNWDFFTGLFCDLALDMDASWLAKHTIFRGPVAPLLKSLGGIPVKRNASHNVVSQVAAEFARRDKLVLAITPEGTRRKVTGWKSGYWHIARAAGVPILPVGLDFAKRAAVIGPLRYPTDSLQDDEAAFRRFFDTITPRNPALR